MSGAAFFAILGGLAKSGQNRAQARILREQAGRERVVAGREADLFRRRQGALLASDRAARGASGVAGGSGLLVDDATMLEILLGEATIREGGEIRARRLTQQANIRKNTAVLGLLGGAVGGATLLTEPADFGVT